MNPSSPRLDLRTIAHGPYGWPWRQLRIPEAHRVTRGRPEVVVAVIDLGYRPHPQHRGHLWVNPAPSRGDIHGWDFFDDDASLAFEGPNADTDYCSGHHAFIVGEVVSCAPHCRVMVIRVGYGQKDCWWRAIDYAVAHGARILCMPHGFLPHGDDPVTPLFYRGTDFSYPMENPQLRRALDDAWDAGCLFFCGTADNRGRRVAFYPGLESIIAVGSSNRRGEAADVCCSADYVEVAAPGGQQSATDPRGHIWCTGGHRDFVRFDGGCMAAGFAAGVAALVVSRYPDLSNTQVRQILRNTAGNRVWDPRLGWGILNAAKAVSLRSEDLAQRLRVIPSSCRLVRRSGHLVAQIDVENRGVFDVQRALLVAFNGNPLVAAAPEGTRTKPVLLVTKQLGHAMQPVRGLERRRFELELVEKPARSLWLQLCSLDRHGSPEIETLTVTRALKQRKGFDL